MAFYVNLYQHHHQQLHLSCPTLLRLLSVQRFTVHISQQGISCRFFFKYCFSYSLASPNFLSSVFLFVLHTHKTHTHTCRTLLLQYPFYFHVFDMTTLVILPQSSFFQDFQNSCHNISLGMSFLILSPAKTNHFTGTAEQQ